LIFQIQANFSVSELYDNKFISNNFYTVGHKRKYQSKAHVEKFILTLYCDSKCDKTETSIEHKICEEGEKDKDIDKDKAKR
jgi:hypothetical protein